MTQAPIYSLAQELIDLIVDEVASLTHNITAYQDQPQIKDIVACSLVSKAFHSRAKVHLLSRLHIRASEDFKSWAKSLVDRIENGPSDCCVPVLVSLCCAAVANRDSKWTLDPRGHPRSLPNPTTVDRLCAHLGDPFLGILHTISSPRYKTQHFSLVAMSELSLVKPPPEKQTTLNFQTALSNACTAVSLKTLHLANIANIPWLKIMEVFFLPCLEELTLNNLAFEETETSEISLDITLQAGNFSLRTVAPKLQRLEIRNISYLGLFRWLNLPPPSTPPPHSSSLAFACLDNLIISLPFDEQRFPIYGALTTIWNFMVRVASTLISLEIESYAYPTGKRLS